MIDQTRQFFLHVAAKTNINKVIAYNWPLLAIKRISAATKQTAPSYVDNWPD